MTRHDHMLGEFYSLVYQMAKKLEKGLPSDKTAPSDKLQDYWNIIPVTLGEAGQIRATKWNPELNVNGILYTTFTDKVMLLPERIINGKGDELVICKNRCLIDVFRIPLKEEPTLLNILRIAFANGRIMAQHRASDFPEGLLKAYKDLHVYDLINYVNEGEDWDPPAEADLGNLFLQLKRRLLEEFRIIDS